jgi:lipoyl(octanoyl) transferase
LISILQLGTLDYAAGLELQGKLVELRKEGRIGDVLLLLQHAPVITLGRNAKHKNIVASPELLAQRGVDMYECDRGGDVTFHGPGQLVGYPIFDLRGMPTRESNRKSMGAIEYVRNLEEVLIRTCVDFAIPTKRICGLTGVWTSDGHEGVAEGKLAAIGVHISRSVTSHGFALNVSTDLSFFNLIVPCGITDKPVTSMARELGREISLHDVEQSVSRNFGFVFKQQMLWLEALEDLIPAPSDLPLQVPDKLRKLRGEEETFRA